MTTAQLDKIRAPYLADPFSSQWASLSAEDRRYLLYGTGEPIDYSSGGTPGPVSTDFVSIYNLKTEAERDIWYARQLLGGVPASGLGIDQQYANLLLERYAAGPGGSVTTASGQPLYPTGPDQTAAQGSNQPPQTTVTTTPGMVQSTDITNAASTVPEQVRNAGITATGRNALNWDEWNWYWKGITGVNAPAPEDRGFSRDASGAVLINGAATYTFDVWFAASMGTSAGAGTGGSTSTGGGGGGSTGGGSTSPLGAYNTILDMLARAVKIILAGYGT